MARWVGLFLLTLMVGCAGRHGPVAMSSADRWVSQQGGRCFGAEASLASAAGARLASAIDRPVRVSVIDRRELLAYGWRSGDVVVTRALVEQLTPDELTAVIGHEIGHLRTDAKNPTLLTGRRSADEIEMRADDECLSLLNTIGAPSSSMRTALEKVLASQPPEAACRPLLQRRIARLP